MEESKVKTAEEVTAVLKTYDILECPRCDKLCKPKSIKKNGTVVYQRHMCADGYYHFGIDITGDLIE